MLCYIRDTYPMYSEINLANADNPGGYVTFEKGMLFRHTKGDKAVFVILDMRKENRQIGGDHWWVDIFINNTYGRWSLPRLQSLVDNGEIEVVK